MDDFFKGKTFIVTGASSGIGRSLTVSLLQHGATVAAMARNKTKLAAIAEEYGGNNLLLCPGDVTRENDCKKTVEKAHRKLHRLDGIINNAGVSMRALARETGVKIFQDLFDVNFYSVLYMYKHAIRYISHGHFVAVSSMQGHYSTQTRSGYAASKHALQGFMNSVRLEHPEEDIHFLTVSPGYVKTEISRNAVTASGAKHGKLDAGQAGGLSPDLVAQKILNALVMRKRDIYPAGFKERTGLFLSKWAPAVLDYLLLRSNVT